MDTSDHKNNFLQKYILGKIKFKRTAKLFLICLLILVVFVLLVDLYVGSHSKGKLYADISQVPHRRAALVLGCGKYVDDRINLFYKYRIEAAAELFNSGKVDAIIVSGDNSTKDYDEPSSMKADLVERGVPSEYITIDYAGFRTLDSIVRAEKVFGLENYIIVSQRFHCQRAIYLANANGQSAIGYCAADVNSGSGTKTRIRESLARVKALIDITISKDPKFLGQKETVNYRVENK